MPIGHCTFLNVVIYLFLSISMFFLTIIWANNTLVEEQGFIKQNASGILDMDHLNVENSWIDAGAASLESKNLAPNTDHIKEKRKVLLEQKNGTSKLSNVQLGKTCIARLILAGNYSLSYGIFCLMLNQPVCLMLGINAMYCALVIFMCFIQITVFGKVQPAESQRLKNKFWNFIFYKFIFIFGVLNVQSLIEVFFWVLWFTAIMFLLLLTKLSKIRLKFLSFSPNTHAYHLWKVVILLNLILLCCLLLTISSVTFPCPVSFSSSANYEIHSMTFMLAECMIVTIKALHAQIRYGIHLYDMRHTELWEKKSVLIFHVDLIMESLSLLVSFVHHVHMLFSSSIWLTMASLVICMELRFIFAAMRVHYFCYSNYRRVVTNMEAQYPVATREEIDDHEDRCAICWDHMETARRLPCGHLFHAPCLRSWLQQDATCPTCRKKLVFRQDSQQDAQDEDNNDAAGGRVRNAAGGRRTHQRHFWHFHPSTPTSWFTGEVNRSRHESHGISLPLLADNNTDQVEEQREVSIRISERDTPLVPVDDTYERGRTDLPRSSTLLCSCEEVHALSVSMCLVSMLYV